MSMSTIFDLFLLFIGVVCFVGMLFCLGVCYTFNQKDEEE